MGLWKNHQIKIEDRGYGDSDKVICSAHIRDSFISEKIRYSHNKGKCSFCEKNRNVLPFNEILAIISPVVKRDYLPAVDTAIYDSETKEYLDTIIDPYDFVYYELNEYLGVEDDAVLQELLNNLSFEDRISPYRNKLRIRQEEQDLSAWDEYCELVIKSELSAEQIISISGKKNISDELEAIRGTLDHVWHYCKEQNLIITLYGLSSQYRAHRYYRCVNYLPLYNADEPKFADLPFLSATLIGTAPAKLVKDNRMSEAGDMMFYGADDKKTAMIEVGEDGVNPITMGTFCSNKMFRVLDLSEISTWKCPSIFDIENAERRNTWFFLREFMERISEEKINENSYKPTQVFTKYIQRKTALKGIKYKSSKTGKSCYVLFVVNRDCLDPNDKRDSGRNQLIMEKVEQLPFEVE